MPEEVLREAREDLLDYQESGMSIMEMSHRGGVYGAVHEETIDNVAKLLGLTDEYAVLFLQGGATTQFSMVPLNLHGDDQVADYALSGSWAAKAVKEATILGRVNISADTAKELPARVPVPGELQLTSGAAYLHITSNETISGAQWNTFPETEAPLIADMSSDIFSRPLDIKRFGLIYAGAQKNLGPGGVTMVIMRKELADRVGDGIPMMFRYKTHIENNSLYNTPPCFAIYILMLVTRWLLKQGGLKAMGKKNEEKARVLYDAIDGSSFYTGTAALEHRSTMNVTFRLPSEELEASFIKEATARGMSGLKGHRSVGGVRASIYNAFPAEGVEALVEFMKTFEEKS